jgi:hypothetical protein
MLVFAPPKCSIELSFLFKAQFLFATTTVMLQKKKTISPTITCCFVSRSTVLSRPRSVVEPSRMPQRLSKALSLDA